jgi:hypothetical protein
MDVPKKSKNPNFQTLAASAQLIFGVDRRRTINELRILPKREHYRFVNNF